MQILKKIIVFLITITISAIVFLLSPSDMFVPVLGLVSATAMVGICTNTILLKIFGSGDQIQPEKLYTQEELVQEYYDEPSAVDETETPAEDEEQPDGTNEQLEQSIFKSSDEKSKAVRFSDTIADVREFVPDNPRRRKHRKRDTAIQEFENALAPDSGITEGSPTGPDNEPASITEPEKPVVEQSVVEQPGTLAPELDGPPTIEDISEGEQEASQTDGATQKRSRRHRR